MTEQPLNEVRVRSMVEHPLNEIGVRVLGALIEKQFTTPDNYPLTLNALTAACNQASNRDPVMHLDEEAVSRSLADLGRRSLARAVHRSDSRALRYRQELAQALHLHDPELAALCVLMLRGPQTPGEIRTRTARMFEFSEPRHVEITLESLMSLPTPLVTKLSRRPGQKEVRYAQLLSGQPQVDAMEEAESQAVASAASAPGTASAPARAGAHERIDALEHDLATLRDEVAGLRAQLDAFRRQFE